MDFEIYDTMVMSTISVTGLEAGDEFYQSFSFENDFVEVDSMVSSFGVGDINTDHEFPLLNFEDFEMTAMTELGNLTLNMTRWKW